MFNLLLVELAQISNPAIKDGPLKTGEGGIGYLVGRLYTLALIVAGLAFFAYLLYGGLRWIITAGDKAGLEASRATITNAFIGLIIVVGAVAVTKLVEVVLGLRILQI